MQPRPDGRFPVRARSCGSRRARTARIGSIRSPLWRHGATFTVRRRVLRLPFPAQESLGALRSALAAKLADGKLTIVNAFELKEPKTKEFRAALDALKVEKTVLIVEAPNAANRNLELSSRNIEGLELIAAMKFIPTICCVTIA